MFVERFVQRPRHIEVQVLADGHGTVLHLGERECSIQRRYQKVIEECPSPFVDESMRAAMGATAVALARAVGYRSAGTVEMIADEQGDFYFLEMNTRLQVEHPVTELVTGIDIVAEQIRIAAGERLSITQDDVTMRGHAIECRVYAEDADAGFLPATGRLALVRFPVGEGIRVDAGVLEGGEISSSFDPMIAKVCAHGATRSEAIARERAALRETVLLGVTTNTAFLERVLATPEFERGETHTGFIDEHADELIGTPDADPSTELALVVAAALAVAGVRPPLDGSRAARLDRRLDLADEMAVEIRLSGGEPHTVAARPASRRRGRDRRRALVRRGAGHRWRPSRRG